MAHKYHIVAFLTVAVWGTTFVWTKLLIINGLSPAQIFTLRFIIAYVLLTGFSLWRGRHKWFSDSWRDELTMMALGLTGGSMYFLTENESLRFTTATNTSLIVCSCPLFAMLIIALFYKSERFGARKIAGSVIALAGMAVVVLNGHFVLHLSPLGDTLAFSACLCWALYTLLMKPVMGRYPAMFITRKVFFYGILTILPYYIFVPDMPSMDVLLRPAVMKHQDAPGTTFKRHMRIAKGVLNEDDYLLQEILFNPYTSDQVAQIRDELKELLDIIDNKDGDRMKQYLTKIRDNVRRDIEISK